MIPCTAVVANRALVVVAVSLLASRVDGAPPAHRAPFAAAWGVARACLVGAPQWSAKLDSARDVQIALGAGDCRAEIDKARRVALDADVDPGFHLAWFRVERALARFDPANIDQLPKLEQELTTLIGLPPPSTTVAKVPMLANTPPWKDTDGASEVEIAAAWDHKLVIRFDRQGTGHTTMTDGPDPTSNPNDGSPTTWNAWLTKKGIYITAPEQHLGKLQGEVLSTFGDGRERAFVYRDFAMGVFLVRSRDAGATWQAPVAVAPGPYQASSAKRGFAPQVDVLWAVDGANRVVRWVVIDGPGPIGKPKDLPLVMVHDFCGTPRGLWWIDTYATKRVGITDDKGSRTISSLADDAQIGACTAEHIVVASSNDLVHCDRARCDPPVHLGKPAFADVTATGELQYVVPIDDLLVIGPAKAGSIKARVVRVDGTVVGAAAFYGGPLHVVVLHAAGISEDPVYP